MHLVIRRESRRAFSLLRGTLVRTQELPQPGRGLVEKGRRIVGLRLVVRRARFVKRLIEGRQARAELLGELIARFFWERIVGSVLERREGPSVVLPCPFQVLPRTLPQFGDSGLEL